MTKKIDLFIPGEITENSLKLPEGLTYEEWEEIGGKIWQMNNATMWWVGDWLSYGETNYGETYAQAMDDTQYSYGTLRIAKHVSERFRELLSRRNNLSFGHHQAVAPLEPSDQDRFLDLAEKHGWTRRELRQRVKWWKLDGQASPPELVDEEQGIYLGNSFDLAGMIPDASSTLIFTDPPYAEKDLPLYESLGRLADRILVDGGSVVTFLGQHYIPEVISLMSPLKYFWPLCCLHTGNNAEMREYGIKVGWKPMLWFVKGDFRRDREEWVYDLVESSKEKDQHEWQQSLREAEYYVGGLSRPGDLVVDPFCGGGTTALAAKRLGRSWWTADKDPEAVEKARKRLKDDPEV